MVGAIDELMLRRVGVDAPPRGRKKAVWMLCEANDLGVDDGDETGTLRVDVGGDTRVETEREAQDATNFC